MDEMLHIQVNRGSIILVKGDKYVYVCENVPLTTGVVAGQE